MLLDPWWLIPLLFAGLCGLVCPLLGTLLVLQQRASGLGLVITLTGCGLALGLNQPPGPLIASACLAVLMRRAHTNAP